MAEADIIRQSRVQLNALHREMVGLAAVESVRGVERVMVAVSELAVILEAALEIVENRSVKP